MSARTAPLESVTVPLIAPFVVLWAHSTHGINKLKVATRARIRAADKNRMILPPSWKFIFRPGCCLIKNTPHWPVTACLFGARSEGKCIRFAIRLLWDEPCHGRDEKGDELTTEENRKTRL